MATAQGNLVIRFLANTTQFTSGAGKVASGLSGISNRSFHSATALGKLRIALNGATVAMGGVVSKIGMTLGMFGALGTAAFAFTSAGKAAMTFEKTMVDVRANARLLGTQGAAQFGELSDAAREMGRTTMFTATQAAEALNQLTLGGLTAKQSIAALPNVLNLAAASNLDLAEAAKIVVDNMVVYRMRAEETGKIGDYLSSAQSRAQSTAAELAEALRSLGSQAADIHAPFLDVVTILTAMAKAGTRGEEAGTALAVALSRLLRAPKEVERALAQMNIQLADFKLPGGAYDLIGLFEEMSRKMPTDELKRAAMAAHIFGARARKMGGMFGLMQSGNFVQETQKGIATDTGRAAEIANAKMNTFWGTIKKLISALESLGISMIGPVLKGMESFIDVITGAARVIDEFWKSFEKTPLFTFIGWLGKAGIALIAMGGAMAIIVPLVTSIGTGLATLWAVAVSPIGLLALAIGGVAVAMTLLIGKGDTFGEKFVDMITKVWRFFKATFAAIYAFGKGVFHNLMIWVKTITGPLIALDHALYLLNVKGKSYGEAMAGYKQKLAELWNPKDMMAADPFGDAATAFRDAMKSGFEDGVNAGIAKIDWDKINGPWKGSQYTYTPGLSYSEQVRNMARAQGMTPWEYLGQAAPSTPQTLPDQSYKTARASLQGTQEAWHDIISGMGRKNEMQKMLEELKKQTNATERGADASEDLADQWRNAEAVEMPA